MDTLCTSFFAWMKKREKSIWVAVKDKRYTWLKPRPNFGEDAAREWLKNSICYPYPKGALMGGGGSSCSDGLLEALGIKHKR